MCYLLMHQRGAAILAATNGKITGGLGQRPLDAHGPLPAGRRAVSLAAGMTSANGGPVADER